jgi:translocation and assembly module TamB
VGAKWTDRLVPSLDTESAGGLALSAQGFRLSTFYPFVANVLSRLDGKMDGNVTIEWGRVGEGWAGRFERAKLALSDVVVFVPQFGQELRNGKATLSLAEVTQRTQELKLSGFEARGSSGRLSGEASLVLTGLRVDAARGAITIREGEELPITVEGVPLGRASGNLTFEAKPTDDSIDVDVRLRSAKILLPESSGRNVQMLDPAHGVVIAQPIEAPVDTSRGPDALRWVFRTTVDDADVRSQMIDVRFRTVESAPLVLELSNEIHASGEIRLSRGAIQLRDRRFEIDQGLVRLRDEEPGNPYVNLTAHWDGPDGTRIYVDYTGILMPITDEKIRFRSDPPKTQAEILALLLFGETGGTAAGLVGTVGSSFATSFASDLLAAAFGGVIRDVAVSVGETEEGDYYGASVSVSDDWRLGGQYEEVGQNETTQGTRKGSCADLYADWRFAKNWSLRGTTGYCSFKGATSTESDESQEFNLGLDILWQYRY